MSAIDTGLSKKVNAAEMVTAYLEAIEIMRKAYADLTKAQAILRMAFGESTHMEVLPDRYTYGGIEKSLENVQDKVTRKAWRHIIDLLGVRQTMSRKEVDALDVKLESGKVEAITAENVMAVVNGLVQSAPEFAHDAVREVFEFLRPGAGKYDPYRTNEKHARYDLGAKVIITSAVEHGLGRYAHQTYRVSHWRSQDLTSVDRIFHLADGKSMSAANCYRSPLIDAIQTTPTASGNGQTEYFSFRCYQNGNLHLTFLRPDLVARLNRAAGNGNELRGN